MHDRLKRLRLSDRAVYARLALTIGYDREAVVSCATIALAETICIRTVKRSLLRLAHEKLITRRGVVGHAAIISVRRPHAIDAGAKP